MRLAVRLVAGIYVIMYVRACGDRVSWHRDQGPCFQPADPSVEKVSNERETSLDDP